MHRAFVADVPVCACASEGTGPCIPRVADGTGALSRWLGLCCRLLWLGLCCLYLSQCTSRCCVDTIMAYGASSTWYSMSQSVVAWSPKLMIFQGIVGSNATCCRNSRSYSIYPEPPCLSGSRMSRMAYAKRSQVTMSVVPIARNERKQQSQADKVETSSTLGHVNTSRMPTPMESLMSPRTATLSPSNLCISTNLPDWMMVTNLDGMGLSDIDMLRAGLAGWGWSWT